MTQNFTNALPNSTNLGPHDMGPQDIGPNGLDVIGIGNYLAIAVGIANIGLLIALIYVYMKNYRQLKSKFTMGLLVFASLLLLQNVVSTGILILNIVLGMGHHGFDLDRPQFPLSSINIIQLIALSILLKITWE
jgi:chromate transport protein ChrA